MVRRDKVNPSPPTPPWIGFSPRPAKFGGFFYARICRVSPGDEMPIRLVQREKYEKEGEHVNRRKIASEDAMRRWRYCSPLLD